MFNAYTGKLLEAELIGKAEQPPSQERVPEYVPYRQAIEQVKNMQPGDPTDPEPRFSNDLHSTVAELCNLEDYSMLSLYTAVGSALDRYHGVDAFFELRLEGNGGTVRVTVDVTKNPNKTSEKADVILFVPEDALDFLDSKAIYNKLVLESASLIADVLDEKIGEIYG